MKNKVFIYTLLIVLLLGAGAYMWLWPFSVTPSMIGNEMEEGENEEMAEDGNQEQKENEETVGENIKSENVEYSDLYDLRGLKLEEPNLEMVEEKLPKVNGSITIKGSFTDLHLLDSYPASVRVKYTETGLGKANKYLFKVSKSGEFEESVPLDFGLGEYKITISVPQTQYSYDDIAMAKVLSFYVINE